MRKIVKINKLDLKNTVKNVDNIKIRNKNGNNQFQLNDKNRLSIIYPDLSKEWDYKKNYDLKPENVSIGSNRKVWWICSKGHSHQSHVYVRVKGHGCPYCKRKKILKEESLFYTNPALCKEWSPKNKITPYEVYNFSRKRVLWVCSKGHEWKTAVRTRSSGNNCPHCLKYETLDGGRYDSLIDAFYALIFSRNGVKFDYNKRYPGSEKRYDFYIPSENKYIELTSFSSKRNRGKKHYDLYMKNILYKKYYVENILKAKFEFIQRELTKREYAFVFTNVKKA